MFLQKYPRKPQGLLNRPSIIYTTIRDSHRIALRTFNTVHLIKVCAYDIVVLFSPFCRMTS